MISIRTKDVTAVFFHGAWHPVLPGTFEVGELAIAEAPNAPLKYGFLFHMAAVKGCPSTVVSGPLEQIQGWVGGDPLKMLTRDQLTNPAWEAWRLALRRSGGWHNWLHADEDGHLGA